MAIALDGGFPGESAGKAADPLNFSTLGRRAEAHRGQPTVFTRPNAVGKAAGPADLAAGPAHLGTGQPPRTDGIGPVEATSADQSSDLDFNVRLLQESFAHVMANPQLSMEYFYAHMFAHNPEMRPLFPLAMNGVREHVFAALARFVWTLDTPAACAEFLQQTGRDHRKFGVKDKHHQSFFAALQATVAHFSGPGWTADTQAAWAKAVEFADSTMRAASQQDAIAQPPWWLAEVVGHDLRTSTLAVLTIRPGEPLAYQPGQYLDVQVARWPRLWRSYSVANAPRPDGLLDLHVRAVPGGMVSNALVHHVAVGDTLLLGRARGEMIMPAQVERDLLCIAGGTGLAPVKAIIEGVIAATKDAQRRTITLLFGARQAAELYDTPALQVLQSAYRSLSVVPIVSDEPGFSGLTGTVPDLVATREGIEDCEIFISGPAEMVAETEQALAGRVAAEHVHHDPLSELSAS